MKKEHPKQDGIVDAAYNKYIGAEIIMNVPV